MAIIDTGPSHPYLPGFQALWIYQQERFPLFTHGFLIVVFTLSGVMYSGAGRGQVSLPATTAIAAGMFTLLLTFLLLRLLDEFKDAEDDARYRPYRPVPRGLVTLPQLRRLIVLTVGAQVLVQVLWLPQLLPLLMGIYGYLTLMALEFGVPGWLKAHPLIYLFSHMLIMPLMALYATSIGWPGSYPPLTIIGSFAGLSLVNGLVIELGRKIRAPNAEEPGVETYSSLFGPDRAALSWGLALTAGVVLLAFMLPETIALVTACGLWLIAVITVIQFCRRPGRRLANAIEKLSYLWTLVSYALVGLTPVIIRFVGGA